MRPMPWQPPVDLVPAEEAVARRVRRAKLFVFLRRHRHTLFDAAFQEELATLYEDRRKGHPPVPPAVLALDCLDCTDAPYSVGTLVAFRERLIAADLDRRLVERTVEVAVQTKGCGHTALRAALDSSPLWGAGRVEDTYNLVGHAVRKAASVLARQQGRELAEGAAEAGAHAPVVAGTSLKAALDLDWDDPAARIEALGIVLAALAEVEALVAAQPEGPARARAQEGVAVARQVAAQDVEGGGRPDGSATLREGVAPDRRISVEDPDMRHGRKSRSRLIDGYKRHVLRDLDHEVVRAVGLTWANAPEADVTEAIAGDLAAQGATLAELHSDRAYLGSALVRDRAPELVIYCKAWPVRPGPGDRFAKTAFHLDWDRSVLTCPQGEALPFAPGGVVHFPAALCRACPLRDRCTASPRGRSVTIHPDERLLEELRARQHTAAGRAVLRERVHAEHSLAHMGAWQGDRARYRGQRKNLCDTRRMAVVENLHILQRLPDAADLPRAA